MKQNLKNIVCLTSFCLSIFAFESSGIAADPDTKTTKSTVRTPAKGSQRKGVLPTTEETDATLKVAGYAVRVLVALGVL